MAKATIDTMKKTGEALAEVRAQLRQREEQWKTETDGLYALEKELKEKLLADLHGVGLNSFKSVAGETYSVTKVFDYKITNPIAYDAYARENRCVRVDATVMKQRIRKAVEGGEKLDFIEVAERQTISIRGPKKQEAATEV